jgi:hypothetical protein
MKLALPKKRRLANIIDFLSFNQEVRGLVDILNSEISAPDSLVFRPISHPAGFARLITKRRLTIAEAYLKLTSNSAKKMYNERIESLQVLVHHIWHAKNLSMPINTARVQIALMKEAVKRKGDKRRQLELMSDFSRASYGKPAVIRRLLRELHLLEIPETGETLAEMSIGWDDQVHDSMTEGRKSPSQLVLDAFIKGMSRITVAYYDLADPCVYEEVFLAGKILGIRVQIGIEFSVGLRHERQHFMYVPPQTSDFQDLHNFFEDKREQLRPFLEGLRENALRRRNNVNSLLDFFNNSGLRSFNEAYLDLPALQLHPLSWSAIERVTTQGQASRIHLGQVIYQAIKPVLLKRVLYLKNQHLSLYLRYKHGESSAWEVERCQQRYETTRQEYENLTPAIIAERYITPRQQLDYNSVFEKTEDILPLLAECGGYIVFIHPLSQGVQRGIDTLLENYQLITDVEVFNLVDSLQRDPMDIRRFALLIQHLHHKQIQLIQSLFAEWRVAPKDSAYLQKLCQFLHKRPFYVRCSSDAVGWSANIPGMGFVCEESLPPNSEKLLKRTRHATIPQPAATLIQQQNKRYDSKAPVYLLASIASSAKNEVGDENDKENITPLRFWRYIHTSLRSLIVMGLGFIPAYFMLGWAYAIFWFSITAFRNIVVDQISTAGIDPRIWRWGNLDKDNIANCLFFTGYSVPLLYMAKIGFDHAWGAAGWSEGFIFVFLKFWTIAFTNGLYLATHNTLRGFDKAAIRGNFFRTVLSWPLATLGSYGFTPLGVPDVVQSKIWSEVVGGVIEGSVKLLKQAKLAQKALLEIYRQILGSDNLSSSIARIDILFFWAKYQQGFKALKKFMHLSPRQEKQFAPEVVQEIHSANSQIYEFFTTEGSIEALTYVTLEYYPLENLAVLSDFIGQSHEPFVQWLEKHCSDRLAVAENVLELEAKEPEQSSDEFPETSDDSEVHLEIDH